MATARQCSSVGRSSQVRPAKPAIAVRTAGGRTLRLRLARWPIEGCGAFRRWTGQNERLRAFTRASSRRRARNRAFARNACAQGGGRHGFAWSFGTGASTRISIGVCVDRLSWSHWVAHPRAAQRGQTTNADCVERKSPGTAATPRQHPRRQRRAGSRSVRNTRESSVPRSRDRSADVCVAIRV